MRCRCAIITGLCYWSVAHAQTWEAVRLHPPEGALSQVYAVGVGVQGGSVRTISPVQTSPVLWRGTSASWSVLAPGGIGVGDVRAIWDSVQVGELSGCAVLWTGTPESLVNLEPGRLSTALAVRGGMQVGTVIIGSNHAAVWRGTASSFVDLHPAGAGSSIANATDGQLQGGYVNSQAAIWNGTAQSVVLLGPPGLRVAGMAPGIQVGWVSSGGERAAVWRGTPESWVDLNPPGGSTKLFATTGRIHVGQGFVGGHTGAARAILNYGTRPDTWLDLHPSLPPGYTGFSAANAVYQNGPAISVGGYAFNSGGNEEAFLWIGTDPCYPNCDQSTAGPLLNINDFLCFLHLFNDGDGYANCDRSTAEPVLNVSDFICFLNRYAAGCP